MAEIITGPNSNVYELEGICIETSEFIDLVGKWSKGSKVVTLLTGDYSQKDRTLLTGIEDIRNHDSLVYSPFTLKIDSIEISSRVDRMRIDCMPSDKIRHTKLIGDLKPYINTPAIRLTRSIYIITLLSVMFVSYKFGAANDKFTVLSIAALVALLMLFIEIKLKKVLLVGVYFRPRDGFFKRNRDSIIVGTIMALVGAGLGVLVTNLSSNSPPASEKTDNP